MKLSNRDHLIEMIKKSELEALEEILENGDVSKEEMEGEIGGKILLIEAVLHDNDGWDTLYYAITHNYKSLDLLNYLLEKGANINTRENAGESALNWIVNDEVNDYKETISFFKENIHLLDVDNKNMLKAYS